MKALKIEGSKGHFLTENGTYETIDKIDKCILLKLVNSALEDDFEIDEYNEESLRNQAHQIIYKIYIMKETGSVTSLNVCF
jgi:hypothetical protein